MHCVAVFTLWLEEWSPRLIQSFLTFDFVDRTLKCDHSLESCWGVLFCDVCIFQFVILERLSILDLALSEVKGLRFIKSLFLIIHRNCIFCSCVLYLVCIFQAQKGYTSLTGVDYSSKAIELASSIAVEEHVGINYMVNFDGYFLFCFLIHLCSGCPSLIN